MSTRFFLIFIAPCWSAAYADPQTREQEQVAKNCAGVPAERLDALRAFVRKQPKDAPHGRVVTDARAWAKPTKDEAAIPDGCIVAVVRELLAVEGRTSEQGQADARRKREASVRAAWEGLSKPEKLWVLSFRIKGEVPRLISGEVGDIGSFSDDITFKAVQIVSKSEVLVSRLGKLGKLAGVDTSGLVDNEYFRAPTGVFWIPRTETYKTVSGGSNTVYYCERIDVDPEKLKSVVPPADVFAKAGKRGEKAPAAPSAPATSKTDAPPVSAGSGFLVGRSLVVTNYHVIREARSIRCFVSEVPFDASVIAHDRESDLALLRLEKEPSSALHVLEVGDSAKIAQGERVYAMGYPLTDVLGKGLHVHEGIVSSVVGFEGRASEFQVGMSLNPGNSGGPLLDGAGRVVGVIASKLSLGYAIQTGTIPEGVTFAIKADLLRSLVSTAGVSGEVQFDTTTRSPTTLEDVTSTFGKAVVRVEVNR